MQCPGCSSLMVSHTMWVVPYWLLRSTTNHYFIGSEIHRASLVSRQHGWAEDFLDLWRTPPGDDIIDSPFCETSHIQAGVRSLDRNTDVPPAGQALK